MIRFLLIILFLALGSVHAGLSDRVGSKQVPDWFTDPPMGYRNHFIIGSGYHRDIDSARWLAKADAVRRLTEERGITVGSSVSEHEQEDGKHRVSSHLSWSIERTRLDSLRVADEHGTVEYGGLYGMHVLVRYPRAPDERRWRPPRPLLATMSIIAPGSGHMTVGMRTRGRKVLGIALVLAGTAVGTHMYDRHLSRQQRAVRWDDPSLKDWSNLSVSLYLVLGILSALDVSSSTYLSSYD